MRNAMDVQEVAVGWWPGDARHAKAAFYAYAHPAPPEFATAPPEFATTALTPDGAHWDTKLGEYVLDWDDVRRSPDPHAAALLFARSAAQHACLVCDWDPKLVASLHGRPSPVR